MAESTIIRTKRDGIIAITDAIRTYTIAYEPGDFTFDVPGETVTLYLDRGVIGSTPSIRNADDQPMTLSFTAALRDCVSASHATLLDLAVIFASGYVSSTWTDTMGTNSDTKTYTITWTVEGSDHGGSDVTLSFPFVVVRGSVSEGDPDTVSISGTSYALRPTFA